VCHETEKGEGDVMICSGECSSIHSRGCRVTRALEGVRHLSSELHAVTDERSAARLASNILLEVVSADRALVAFTRGDDPEHDAERLELALVHTRPRSDTAPTLGPVTIVPLVAHGRVLGAIQLERFDPDDDHFDDVDLLIAEIAADLLAGAVEAARAHAAARD
jgi:hypothetical protein